MPYTKVELRLAVRSMLQNVGDLSLTDQKLDVLLSQAKRRLDKDKPNVKSVDITGTGKKFYQLTTTVPGWINNFSVVNLLQNPKVVIANDDTIRYADPKDLRVLEQDGIEYLRVDSIIKSASVASLRFTTPWSLTGVDSATTTTLTSIMQNAIEFLACSIVCQSLATKSAGQLDDQTEADIINWGGKQAQYKFVSKDYEEMYFLEIGLDKGKIKPIMMRMDYDQDPRRIQSMTHLYR